MNTPQALHCSACGRELGLEPLGEPGDLYCARCRDIRLDAFASGPGRLLDCSHCGGQFVEHALLKELLERRQVYGHAVPRQPTVPAQPEPVSYIPCPECEALMTRRNFGGNSGVIVDVCAKHGIWFDVGELPRVMAFVESGGLARVEARQDQTGPRRSHLGVSPAAQRLETPALVGETDLLDDLAEAAVALLRFVSGAARRD